MNLDTAMLMHFPKNHAQNSTLPAKKLMDRQLLRWCTSAGTLVTQRSSWVTTIQDQFYRKWKVGNAWNGRTMLAAAQQFLGSMKVSCSKGWHIKAPMEVC
jgi:hypothetical protein